ncbi:MAG: hypothetical protein IJX51_00150 [Clostridia bacterium]|nr:hypothetical protein [Clostridia bacterium]
MKGIMTKNKILKISLAVAFMLCILLAVWIFSPVKAETPVATVITDQNTIIFDLYAKDIEIGSTTYTGAGYVFNETEGKWEYSSSIYGTHKDGNSYYIFQSTETNTATISDDGLSVTLPTYADISDIDVFVNKTDINQVITDWQAAAESAGRKSTTKKVLISASGVTRNITIENIWTTYRGTSLNSMTNGGISVTGAKTGNTIINLYLKGDNRLGALRYSTGSVTTSQLNIDSVENGTTKGSLVVIGDQSGDRANNSYRFWNGENYVEGAVCSNHWDSVIGGNDSSENVRGLNIKGGTVYAGASKYENCTAIGGGGNGTAVVNISGGIVTAVASTTGTAIGGGIAHTSYGGPGTVNISNGAQVYAYNFGQPFAENLSSSGQKSLKNQTGSYGVFVPGTAIGGGGSALQYGSKGTVTIAGDDTYVYAYSAGGSGIGGGNTVGSTTNTAHVGGEATVTVNGGTVYSISASIYVQATDAIGNVIDQTIPAGTGIGGGTSTNQNGGKGTVTINGGIVTANGIGGGGSTKKEGGYADITVNGGTIVADSIGGGYSEAKGYARGSVKITGGSLSSQLSIIPTNGSVPVYLTTIGTADINNQAFHEKSITSVEFKKGTYDYSLNDVYTDANGRVYLWLPADEAVKSAVVDADGTPTTILPIDENDGEINSKSMGVLRLDNGLKRYMVTLVMSKYYNLFNADGTPYTGVIFCSQNDQFTYYVQTNQDANGNYYSVHPYVSVIDANGNKTFQKNAELDPVAGVTGMYTKTFTVDNDTTILFEVITPDGEKIFVMDWYNGDVTVTSDPKGGIIIEQNGYTITGYDGALYLTTGGLPCSSKLNIDCEDKEIEVHLDTVSVSSDYSAINVSSGTLDLFYSEADNSVSSTKPGSSAIFIDEGATLKLNSTNGSSIKIDSPEGSPAIAGTGTLILSDGNGHLHLNEAFNNDNGVSNISVGTYEYSGTNADYTATLNDGEFSFELIGYVSNGVLYAVSDMDGENRENFSARGIIKVYTDTVTEQSITVKDGDLIIVLGTTASDRNLVTPTVELVDGTILALDIDYMFDENTKTLTIKGSAFQKGNMRIFASTVGEISYDAQNTDRVYNNEEFHIGMQVQTSKFDVYYSLTEFPDSPDAAYLEGAGVFKNTHITRINVGTDIIYFYITANEEYADQIYTPVKGNRTLTVTKGENEWQGQRLSCNDIVLNSTLNEGVNPVATSKWGTVKYKYYTSPDGDDATKVSVDTIGQSVNTYYVRAYVEASPDGNYDYIETDYLIRFYVFETNVFTSPEKSFNVVTGADKVIKMPANKAFSIYYEASYTAGMNLEFSVALDVGTKITLIDFSSSRAMYYAYTVQESDVVGGITCISLNSFKLMADDTITITPSSHIKYQFCVEPAENGEFQRMMVSFGDMEKVTVEPISAIEASFSETPTNKNVVGVAEIPIKITSNGASSISGYDNVLSVRIPRLPNGSSVYLKNSDGTILYPRCVEGLYTFSLGTANMNEREYTLIIENLNNGEDYSVSADIRICTEEESMYSLSGGNSANSFTITLKYTSSSKVYITMVDRILSVGSEEIVFNTHMTGTIDSISGGIYKKNANGGYDIYTEITPNNITFEDTSSSVTVNLVDAPLTEGTYKIIASVNGNSCEYMFIVH